MAVESRTRRFVPAVLVSLALLLGLSAAGTAAFVPAGARPPAGATAAPAAPVADAHVARWGSDVAPHSRPAWDRTNGATPVLLAALLAAAASVPALLRRWFSARATRAVPAGHERFTCESRAPPCAVLPATGPA